MFNIAKTQVIVGLDFGTTYSGFGICHVEDREKVSIFDHWEDQLGPYPKTKTAILLDDNTKSVVAWGNTAVRKYKTEIMGPEKHLYERFKLALHPSSGVTVPRGYDPIKLISQYLQLMKDYILKFIERAFGDTVKMENVKWVLTVPAIWKEVEKASMRRAAVLAGIIPSMKTGPEKFMICYEPEAAAMACKVIGSLKLSEGDVFMIVDLGGGTADIVTQIVCGSGEDVHFREVSVGSGGACGSIFVDEQFFNFVKEKVTHQAWDAFQKKKNWEQTYYGMYEKWEILKSSLNVSQSHFQFEIPGRLWSCIPEDRKRKLEEEAMIEEVLVISKKEMDEIFNPVLEKIGALIKGQLEACHDCKRIILVGGFARSSFVLNYVRSLFETDDVKVLVPVHPAEAVIYGAVLYGLNSKMMKSRRSRMTYGIVIFRPYQEGDPEDLIVDFPEIGKSCKRFNVFVRRGEEVEYDRVVTHTFVPVERDKLRMRIRVLCTELENPKYPNELGVTELGHFTVSTPDTTGGLNREVTVEFKFGDVELQVYARDIQSGNFAQKSFKFSEI